MKSKSRIWVIGGIVLFAAGFFIAARPIPQETVLVPRWLVSLETGIPSTLTDSQEVSPEPRSAGNLMPFELGSRFGYFDRQGNFSINQHRMANVSLAPQRWAEYGPEPDAITVMGSDGEALAIIENPRGYPFFIDGRTFLINSENNAISAVDDSGAISWTYEFASEITSVDAAAGLLLAGTLDGVLSVVDSGGRQVFSFEPGGSRYSVIYGCAISHDGSLLAVISGLDEQRFLLLERYGNNDYRVIYHEFLESRFTRPVVIAFIEEDRWIIFEHHNGLGFYRVGSRQTGHVKINGELSAIDLSGGQGLIFAIVSPHAPENAQELLSISLPGRVIMRAPFKCEEVFLGRAGTRLFIGGGQSLIAFDLEKR